MVDISQRQAYKLKRHAKKNIQGANIIQYCKLRAHAETLLNVMPGSHAPSMWKELKRMHFPHSRYVLVFECYEDGFLVGCRSIVGLNMCFLKVTSVVSY